MRSRRVGFRCDGRVLALNSYENRVYQIGVEDGEPVVAKFYRPGRWSDAAIREEHAFAAELAAQEIPVVAPLSQRRADPAFSHGLPLRGVSAPGRPLARARHDAREGVGGAVSGPNSCGRACGAVSSDAARTEHRRISGEARAISCSTATGCPITWPTNTRTSPSTLLEEVEARARGWRGASTRAHPRGLPPRQYPVDRRGPAFRRSRRLRDRPRDPGSVDAARREPRGNGRGAHRPPRGYEQFLPFNRARSWR